MIITKLTNSPTFAAFSVGVALTLVVCLLLLAHLSFLDSLAFEAATLGALLIPVTIFAGICQFRVTAALKQSSTGLLNSLHLPTFLLDAQHRCLIANIYAQELLGQSLVDIAGQPFNASCILKDQHEAFDRFLAQANLQTAVIGEFTVVTNHGARIAVELTAKKTQKRQFRNAETLIIVQNSKLKAQVQAELIQSNLEFTQFLETVSTAMAAIDVDHKVTLWNRAAERITGLSKSAVLGRRMPLGGDSPNNIVLLAAIDQALLGIETINLEMSVSRADGEKLDLLANIVTRRRYDGAVTGALLSVANITPLKKKARLSAESEKLQALGTLTGGVAHDFNNLLTIIIGNLSLLSEDKQTLTDAEFDEITTDALSAASDGAHLTRQLLLFARRQPLEPVSTNINELLYSAARLMRHNLGEQITLKITPHASSPFGLADPALLESAILNLCFNARDALLSQGLIEIVVGLDSIVSSVASVAADRSAGDYVSISVIDHGVGIPATALEHIFEPFWTTKPQGKGSGLGLSMVQGFVAQSKGFVTVSSAVGEPTIVTLNLPKCHLPRPSALAPSVDVSAPTLVNKVPKPMDANAAKILVVEDDAIIRTYALRCLESLGHETAQASNAAEAIEVLQTDPQIGIVFSDIQMPGAMSGRGLQQLIEKQYPHIKILLTTGYEDLAKIRAGKADQAFTDPSLILKKPYTRASLTETLASLT